MIGPPVQQAMLDDLAARAARLREEGFYKQERVIASPQSAHIELADDSSVLNLCANNYLGLADHPAVVEAARSALDAHGYGIRQGGARWRKHRLCIENMRSGSR